MARPRIFKWFLFIAVPVGLIGSCFAHLPAKPTRAQKTFITSRGESITFTLWSAERLWKLPFFDGAAMYVQLGDRRVRLHGGSFGEGVGGILVSPDKSMVIFERSFEGGATSGLFVDLKTQEIRFVSNPGVIGWDRVSWRTSLEALSRSELHARLSSPDFETVRLAMKELEAREFENEDWLVLATIFADRKAPVSIRKYLGHSVVYHREDQADRWRREAYFGSTTQPAPPFKHMSFDYGRVKLQWPDEIVQLVKSTLDDPNPEIQAEAKSILSDMLPGPPTTLPTTQSH